MNDTTMFAVTIVMACIATSLVLVDWYVMHRRYCFSNVPNLVNRIFAFFCLAMLAGNAIMVAKTEYRAAIYFSSVVALTELFFLCTNKVKQ